MIRFYSINILYVYDTIWFNMMRCGFDLTPLLNSLTVRLPWLKSGEGITALPIRWIRPGKLLWFRSSTEPWKEILKKPAGLSPTWSTRKLISRASRRMWNWWCSMVSPGLQQRLLHGSLKENGLLENFNNNWKDSWWLKGNQIIRLKLGIDLKESTLYQRVTT